MTKTKESVERVKDLKAQVKDLLGVDAMMDEDVTKDMKETLITQAKNNGEEHIKEVIDTIEKALEKIKDPEFKTIIASIIWTKCPMGMGNPLVGLALLAATLKNKLHE